MAKSFLITLTFFYFILTVASAECTCDPNSIAKDSKTMTTKYKVVALFVIMVAGTLGVYLPTFHQVFVFLCIKSVPILHVKPEERFLVGHVGPKEFRLYRCIVRYGYHDFHKDGTDFENDLVCSIAEFIQGERKGLNEDPETEDGEMFSVGAPSTFAKGVRVFEEPEERPESSKLKEIQPPPPPLAPQPRKRVWFLVPESPKITNDAQKELQDLMEARESGMAYIIGDTHLRAKPDSSFLKKKVSMTRKDLAILEKEIFNFERKGNKREEISYEL